jgi:exosortase
MIAQTARNQFAFRSTVLPALVCALAGAIVFQFFGNATQGYIHSRSLFVWWGSQWFDPAAETQHGLLVLLVALWLFWRNLRDGRKSAAGFAPAERAAVKAMLAGLLLHMAGYAMQQTRVSIAGFLVFVWGVLVLGGGRRWGSAAVFPLSFLLLAVPVSFVDSLGFSLRLVVTEQAYGLSQKLGVALLRNGTELFSPDGRFQYDVAAACSGIRSLVALLALALLVGYLGFLSWFPRAILAAVCLPYVIVGNVVRVVGLVVAGERFGQATGSRLHDSSGLVVFILVLGLLLATAALLRRVGFRPADAAEAEGDLDDPPIGDSRLQPWSVAAITVFVALGVCFTAWKLSSRSSQSVAGLRLTDDDVSPVDLPACIGTEWIGRRVAVSQMERDVLPLDTGYSRRNYVSVDDLKRQVFVSLVLSGRDRTSIHRPELCLVGQGWTIANWFKHEFSAGGETVPMTVLRVTHAAVDAQGRRVQVGALFAYCFVGGDNVEPTHFGMQWSDMIDRLRHFRADRWAYVVVQSVVSDADEAATLTRMQEIVSGVWPTIRSCPPGRN